MKQVNNKKLVNHESTYRYLVSDKRIAIVTKKGKIKAVGKGICYVYIYANNGVSKKIKVRVK